MQRERARERERLTHVKWKLVFPTIDCYPSLTIKILFGNRKSKQTTNY